VDRNLLLAFVLSFLVLYGFSALQRANAPPPPVPGEPTAGAPAPEGGREVPARQAAERFPELPPAEVEVPAARPPVQRPSADEAEVEATQIAVRSTLYGAVVSTRGGALEHWTLERYEDKQGNPVQILEMGGVEDVVSTPFLELGLGDLSVAEWRLESQSDEEVVFSIERGGVSIRKTYLFDTDGYGFRVRVDLENGSSGVVAPAFLVDWPTRVRTDPDFRELSLAVLHEGSVTQVPLAGLGRPGFFGSLFSGGGPPEYEYPREVDWAGLQSTYFLGALFPESPSQANARFVVVEEGDVGAVQVFYPPVQVPVGQQVSREYRGYLGPKEVDRLEALGGGALASIDLGWSWIAPLTRGFAWMLHALHSVIPNYGVAIILLTIMVRLVTAPLTVRQMRSMERMRRVQPRMKEIQEKYKDDRQRQSEEMMRLYRQEKVNPLGGCFPMLLQLPVFIGLFYALRSSIDLRHAHFVGWIDDLSAPDQLFVIPGLEIPLRVLPLVMGATMFVQQKITPMQIDPAQARMMLIVMPLMMTVLFYQFPSGLVLYWMLSNVLAILHQLWIGRKMDPPTASATA
jgi:YidC/Oxa1 family membrane protein insertase